jgi:hypothetical protein
MSDASSILVLSACTASKSTDGRARSRLAEELYAGQQHRRLMRGVDAYRAAGEPGGTLELQILSAGHGVIAAATLLESYDATFAGLRRPQIRRRAKRLGVPGAVARLLKQRRRLALLLLGENYLHAAQLNVGTALGAPTLVLTSPRGAARLASLPQLHPIALDNRDAERFSCGLIALKGELTARLLMKLSNVPDAQVPVKRTDLLTWLQASPEARGTQARMLDWARVA